MTRPWLWPLLIAIVIAATILSIAVGSAAISPGRIVAALTGDGDPVVRAIVLDLRLPRTLLALSVGAMLGLSGAALQGFLRNPLAEPSLLGASNGAALGAVVALYFGLAASHEWTLPLLAILGALTALAVLFTLTGRSESPLTLILAGIAVSTLAGAAISLALNLAPNPFAAMEIASWLLGSFEDRSMTHVVIALPCIAAGVALLAWDGRALDALTLGEDGAAAHGSSGTVWWGLGQAVRPQSMPLRAGTSM